MEQRGTIILDIIVSNVCDVAHTTGDNVVFTTTLKRLRLVSRDRVYDIMKTIKMK